MLRSKLEKSLTLTMVHEMCLFSGSKIIKLFSMIKLRSDISDSGWLVC